MKADELVLRAEKALQEIKNGRAKVGRTGADKLEVVERVQKMAQKKAN